jgi:TfoX/Sxy family transcriptional regulator of competence genes
MHQLPSGPGGFALPIRCHICSPLTENEAVAFDEDLAVRIRELVRGEAGVSEKRMFGGLAFMVRGNMAISASGQGGVLVRVEPAKSLELAARPHAQVAVMRGREMPGWLRVDPDGVRTRPQLQRWVDEGIAFARSLPGMPSDSR